jgi:hypothetical protein
MQMPPVALTPSQRLILLNLAWHANEHGENAWPSVATISRETSLSRRAIQVNLPRLVTKGFLVVQGQMPRGSTCYALNLAAFDRARGAQSEGKSTSVDYAPDAQGGAPRAPLTAHVVQEGGAPRAPDPSLNRPDPSEKKNTGADAPVRPLSEQELQERRRALEVLAHETIDAVGLNADFAVLAEHLKGRAAPALIDDSAFVNAVLLRVQHERRLPQPARRRRATG